MDVFIIAALSADGFIAPPAATAAAAVSTAWTGPEDKKRLVAATKAAGALVLGRPTFETFGSRPLKGRLTIVQSRTPPAGALLLEDSAGQAACMVPPPAEGAVLWTRLPPAAIVEQLAKRSFPGLAVCGGSAIYRLWQESGLVDRWLLTIEPRFFGEGIRLFTAGPAAACLPAVLELSSAEARPGGAVFLEYRRPASEASN